MLVLHVLFIALSGYETPKHNRHVTRNGHDCAAYGPGLRMKLRNSAMSRHVRAGSESHTILDVSSSFAMKRTVSLIRTTRAVNSRAEFFLVAMT